MPCKLSFLQLKEEYRKMGVDYNSVFTGIKDVIIKTVLSAEQTILQCNGGSKGKSSCFEIYGFDVLIDAKLRPWLLEVNVSPSLSSSSPMDKQIKTLLLSDSLYLVGFRLLDRKKLEMEKAMTEKQRLLGFDPKKKDKNAEQ
jgi:tubulin polyglutamylase TTLL4